MDGKVLVKAKAKLEKAAKVAEALKEAEKRFQVLLLVVELEMRQRKEIKDVMVAAGLELYWWQYVIFLATIVAAVLLLLRYVII